MILCNFTIIYCSLGSLGCCHGKINLYLLSHILQYKSKVFLLLFAPVKVSYDCSCREGSHRRARTLFYSSLPMRIRSGDECAPCLHSSWLGMWYRHTLPSILNCLPLAAQLLTNTTTFWLLSAPFSFLILIFPFVILG